MLAGQRATSVWQRLCRAATLELNHVRLHKRIEGANAAIRQRLREQLSNHDGAPQKDNARLLRRVQNLGQLQRVAFRSSGPGRNEVGRFI